MLERVKELAERGRPDAIYWSPCHRGPLFAHRHVVTVLDCINIEHVYRGDWRLPVLRGLTGTMLSNANAIVAISMATRDSILRNFHVDASKVIVISGPTDVQTDESSIGSLQEPGPAADGEYVLMITNSLPHKNTALAGRAFAASSAAKRGVGLRVVGTLESEGEKACRSAGVTLDQYQDVDGNTLRNWIVNCRFLFSPSLDEGLNLPVAEALSLGANVLCSDIAVHREFYNGMVLFAPRDDGEAMTESIDIALGYSGKWPLPGSARPLRTFADVASDYHRLFDSIATD
jgi:glycosyltransferase involved in cell wall biosynthesis